jgi:hypothetical protein
MYEDPSYNFVGATPVPSSANRRPVPYNYDNTVPIGQVAKPAYSEDNNVYQGVANNRFTAEFTNDSGGQGPQARTMQLAGETNTGVVTNESNVSFAPQIRTKRNLQEYIISIDSRMRDIQISPNANNYRMALNQFLDRKYGFIRDIQGGIPNIISIELLDVTIPNIIRDSTLRFAEPYLYLNIDEITGLVRTPVDGLPRAFSKIYYDNSEVIRNTSHLTMKPANTLRNYETDNPLSKLNNITLKFYNFDGELFDFGTDSVRITNVVNGVTTVFTTNIPHSMATSDRIYIRGFITGNQTIDNEITRESGWIVAVSSLNTFEIQYDSTGMPTPGAFGFALNARLQNNVTFRIKAFTTDLS